MTYSSGTGVPSMVLWVTGLGVPSLPWSHLRTASAEGTGTCADASNRRGRRGQSTSAWTRSNVVDLDISDMLGHHPVVCASEYSPTGVCRHPKMIRNSEGATLTPPTSNPSPDVPIPCGDTLCRTDSHLHLLLAQLALRNNQLRDRRCLDALMLPPAVLPPSKPTDSVRLGAYAQGMGISAHRGQSGKQASHARA